MLMHENDPGHDEPPSAVAPYLKLLIGAVEDYIAAMDLQMRAPTAVRRFPGGWDGPGYCGHAEVSGRVAGHVFIGADPALAQAIVRHELYTRFDIRDVDFRLALQMAFNSILTHAAERLNECKIDVRFGTLGIYNRRQWAQTTHARLPALEIPLRTPAGCVRLAVHARGGDTRPNDPWSGADAPSSELGTGLRRAG